MHHFNADEWQSGQGRVLIQTTAIDSVQIQVSCTLPVQLVGVRGDEEIPLHNGPGFRVSANCRGFDRLILVGTEGAFFGYCLKTRARQDGEPINHDDPPPPPLPGADNLVAQFHRMVRESHQGPRLMEPEDLPLGNRYEVDDDDERFEEEIIASQQKEKAKAEAKARAEAEAARRAAEEPPTPSEQQKGANPPKTEETA